MSFSEQLAKAKAAARPSKDVQVLIDGGLSDERVAMQGDVERLQAEAASDQRLTGENPKVKAAQKKLNAFLEKSHDALVTLRFTRLPGDQWAEITARCPVRVDAPIDRQYGYNMTAVCKLAAPLSGVRVDGDAEVPLLVTKAAEGVPAVDEWADLFETISGHELGRIIDAVYELNEYAPAQRINELKKGLATHPA